MQRIQLLTHNGQLVNYAQIPTFAINPQVILWGLRYFVRNDKGEYREAQGVWFVSQDNTVSDPSQTKGTVK